MNMTVDEARTNKIQAGIRLIADFFNVVNIAGLYIYVRGIGFSFGYINKVRFNLKTHRLNFKRFFFAAISLNLHTLSLLSSIVNAKLAILKQWL